MTAGKHVVVIGAGGNIGSHLVPHLARMPELSRLTLVDRDRYEARNAHNQEFPPRAAGRRKATVQAARARRIAPSLEVVALAEDIELLPLGTLKADLILACLDSRRGRQWVNHAAGRLGVPWLDGGVLGLGLLARITRYLPGEDQPCLECRWDDADYAALEQAYPCETVTPAPTRSPSGLGALVAGLLALECRKLLTGQGQPLAPGSELVIDAAHHRHFVTAVRRNRACRRSDHGAWTVEPLAGGREATLHELLESSRRRIGGNGDLGIRIDGRRFARRLSCEGCGATRRVLLLSGTARSRGLRCRSCGGAFAVTGFGLTERVASATLTPAERRRRLAALGLRLGDVVTVSSGERKLHLELAAP